MVHGGKGSNQSPANKTRTARDAYFHYLIVALYLQVKSALGTGVLAILTV